MCCRALRHTRGATTRNSVATDAVVTHTHIHTQKYDYEGFKTRTIDFFHPNREHLPDGGQR